MFFDKVQESGSDKRHSPPEASARHTQVKTAAQRARKGTVIALTATILSSVAFAGPAFAGNGTGGQTAPVRQDNKTGYVNCVETGYRLVPLDERGIAPGPFCFNTDDPQNREVPRIADTNKSLTVEDLYRVQDTSVLSPESYLAKDTFAGTPLTGNEPTDPYGREGSRENTQRNMEKSRWVTAGNVGWGTLANENIPVLSTDSSNPHQEWVEIVSRDSRVNNNPTNVHLMTGGVPLPYWYLAKPGQSGDKSVMLYDKATGITRSMFYLQKDADAQVYPAKARFVVGDDAALKKAGAIPTAKINYAGQVAKAGEAAQSAKPTSDDVKQGGVQTREITRSTKFALGKGAPAGATVDPVTGAVSLSASATKGLAAGTVIDVPVDVDHPPVYSFASGGYIHGEPDFKGLGADNYWLNLRSGTSSVVGMQNELTQIGVDELLSGKINHAISMTWMDYSKVSSFPAKMADGSMTPEEFPHTNRAGQRFTFPDEFDVDKFVEQNKGLNMPQDEVMRMILNAAKEYGVIITDRNLFTNAFNFESPAGYAPYAREGKNVYTDNPELKELMRTFVPYNFPIMEAEWLEVDFAEKPGTADEPRQTEKRSTSGVDFVYRSQGNEAYFPEALNSTVYEGQTAILGGMDERLSFSNDWSTHVTPWATGSVLPDPNVSGRAEGSDAGLKFVPKAGWTGTEKLNFRPDWTVNTSSNPGNAKLMHSPIFPDHNKPQLDKSDYHNMVWNANVVPRDQPIAREDSAWIQAGTTQTVDVLMNDEAYFGAGTTIDSTVPEDMLRSGVKNIVLLNNEGKEVKSYSDAHATYTVVTGAADRQHIRVDAKPGVQGYSKLVKYQAVTPEGKKSPVGFFQPKITAMETGKADVQTPPKLGDAPIEAKYNGPAVTVNVLELGKPGSTGTFDGSKVELKQANGTWGKAVTSKSGSFAISADGKGITFTPKGETLEQSTATYRVTDSLGLQAEAKVIANVTGDNPVANPDEAPHGMMNGGPVTIDVLANDTPGKPVSFEGAKLELKNADGTWGTERKADKGTFRVAGNKLTFQVNPDTVNRSEAVTYRVTDSAGRTAESYVKAHTGARGPVGEPDKANAKGGVETRVNVLANDHVFHGMTLGNIQLVAPDGKLVSTLTTEAGVYKVAADGKSITFRSTGFMGAAPGVKYTSTDTIGQRGSQVNSIIYMTVI